MENNFVSRLDRPLSPSPSLSRACSPSFAANLSLSFPAYTSDIFTSPPSPKRAASDYTTPENFVPLSARLLDEGPKRRARLSDVVDQDSPTRVKRPISPFSTSTRANQLTRSAHVLPRGELPLPASASTRREHARQSHVSEDTHLHTRLSSAPETTVCARQSFL